MSNFMKGLLCSVAAFGSIAVTLMEEEHDPRRDGMGPFRQTAVDHAAHIIEVTGTEWSLNSYHALYAHGYIKK